ncbi:MULTISPECIES: hypothetical protein [Streptomyces]|uniref:Uncharacterized protein n=1 Tax=Streptomyces flaveolus TaxID=67297 RepID=A0ABV3AIK7_9ACTN|nr:MULTISPECIES: hypothetical protein [Streptomyces]
MPHRPTVGFLHPGSTGAAVAACALANTAAVLWRTERAGNSTTRRRAD